MKDYTVLRLAQTGYYGIPGKVGGKVHIHFNGHPVCGAKIHPLAEFQWCANGIRYEYLECEKCEAIAIKYYEADLERRAKRLQKLKGKH